MFKTIELEIYLRWKSLIIWPLTMVNGHHLETQKGVKMSGEQHDVEEYAGQSEDRLMLAFLILIKNLY